MTFFKKVKQIIPVNIAYKDTIVNIVLSSQIPSIVLFKNDAVNAPTAVNKNLTPAALP